jgi:cell division topological specificity factor
LLDFFNRFFRPAPPSGATAKERLRLVLLSDHLSLAPDVVESLKRDLLAVISRYVEIDQAHADVTFEHRQNEVAMLANIPITGVRERRRDEPPARPPAPVAASVAERPPEPALGTLSEATRSDAVAAVPDAASAVPDAASAVPDTAFAASDSVAVQPEARAPSSDEASVVAALASIDSSASETTAAVGDSPGLASASEAGPADGLGKPAVSVTVAGTTPRRRRRRKSAAAKRAAQQTIPLNQPAQA